MTKIERQKLRKAIAYLGSDDDEWDKGMEILFTLAKMKHLRLDGLKSVPLNELCKEESVFTYNEKELFR
jgi:hypothetical protein